VQTKTILHRFEVANLPASVHLIRTFVSDEISRLPLSSTAQFDVIAAVGEAANNAVMHGKAVEGRPDTIRTSIGRGNGEVHVEVRDNGLGFRPNLEEWPEPDLMAERGRGVFIMESLADRVIYPEVEEGTLCVIVKAFDESRLPADRLERGEPEARSAETGPLSPERPAVMPPAIYRSLMENALEGVWVVDPDAKTVFVNRRATEMLSCSQEEMLGRPLPDFLSPESVTRHEAARERDRAGESQQFEQTFLKRDGSLLHVLLATSPLYDEKGQYAGSLGLLTDITDRKHAEQALVESERRYRNLFTSLIDGFALHEIVLNDKGEPIDYIFLEVNKAFETLSGLKKEDILGKRVTDVLPGIEKDRANWIGVYGEVALTGKPIRFEQYAQPLGRWYSVSAYSPQKGQFVTVFDDVTDRRHAEEERDALLRRLEEELSGAKLLRTLADIGASTMGVQETGRRQTERLVGELGLKGAFLFLIGEDRRRLLPVATAGFPSEIAEVLRSVQLDGEAEIAKVAGNRRASLIEDLQSDPSVSRDSRSFALSAGVRSAALFPIVLGGDVTGVLGLAWSEVRHFAPEESSFLESVASEVALGLQNARLFEAEVAAQQQAKQELETANLLLQAADVMNTWTDLDSLLQGLAVIVLEVTRRRRVTIGLLDVAQSELKIAASIGQGAVPSGTRFPLEKISSPLRDALLQARTTVADYDRLPEERRGRADQYAGHLALLVPFSYRGRVLGHIGVDDPGERREFSEREIGLVEGIASQAAVVIDNVRLFEAEREAQRKAKQELETTSLLLRAADALAEPIDLDRVLHSLIEVIVEATGRRRVVVSLYDARRKELVVRAGQGGPTIPPGSRIPVSVLAPQVKRSIEERRTYVVDYDAPGMPEESRRRARELSTRISLSVPLFIEDRVIGHIGLDEPGVYREFGERELSIIRGIAAQAVVAIEKARLFEREREGARLSGALHHIEHIIHSTMKPEEILQRALEEGAQALRAETAAIDTHEDGRFRIDYIYGWPGEVLGKLVPDELDTHGVLALRTGETQAIDDTSRDPRVRRELMEEYGIKSVIVAPLTVGGEAFAALYFNYNTRRHDFTEAERSFVSSLGAGLSLALQNARLYQRERQIADALQGALLTMPGRLAGIEFAYAYKGAYETARVGGDFYDLFQLEPGLVGILIGDVSGKGLDSAVLVSSTKSTIRANALTGLDVAAVMERTDEILHGQMSEEAFVTAFFGVLDLVSGTLTYCNSGHPPPLLRRGSGELEELAVTGPLIGAIRDNPGYESGVATLQEGDLLFLYTDGLFEARGDREMFGEERMRDILSETEPLDSRHVIDEMVEAVRQFTGDRLSDDLALLALQRT